MIHGDPPHPHSYQEHDRDKDGTTDTCTYPHECGCTGGGCHDYGAGCGVPVPEKTCLDGSVIPEADTCTKTCADGSVIPETDTCTKTCLNGTVIPETAICTKTCWDNSVIPETDTCPPETKTCWDGQVIPADDICTQTCWDGSVIPYTDTCPPENKTCWNDLVIPVDDPCPPETQTCWDGTVIPATDICPPEPPPTQTCWDGSVIPATDTCPPEPPTQHICWDGSVITPSLGETCPPRTQTCWNGSVIPATDTCPTPPPPTTICWDGSIITPSFGETCPPRTQTCWNGTVILLGQTCPPRPPPTQTCWNGTVIPVGQTCPPQPPTTQTCWDGSVIPATDTCPPQPPPQQTQTCWDGSVIPVTSTCPPQTQTCWDNSVIPITDTCPPQTPAPTRLRVYCSAPSGATAPEIEVRWDAVTGISAPTYEVEGDLSYTGVDTSFTRTGQFLTDYEVRVRAYDSVNNQWTAWSGNASADCPLGAPSDVTVSCVNREIIATWTDPSPHPDNRYLHTLRITEPGDSAQVTAGYLTTTEFRRSGTWPVGTTVLFSVDVENNGDHSQMVRAPVATCVIAPTGLNVDCAANGGNLEVTVTWNALTGMTGYEVTGDLTYNGADTSFAAAGAYGQSYTVQVRATDGSTTTGWSPSASGDCPSPAPTGLALACSADGMTLTVSWDADASAATYEAVEDGGDLAFYAGAANSFTRSSTVGVTYRWQVRSISSGGGQSDWSSWVELACGVIPPTPLNVSMTCVGPPTGAQTLTVTWDPPPGNPSYDIWYNYGNPVNWDSDPNNDEGASLSNRGQTPANRTRNTSISVSLPAPNGQEGRLYTVRVQAESTAGPSSWSQNTGVHDPFAWVRCPGKPPAVPEPGISALCYFATKLVEVEWADIADTASGDTYTYEVRSDPHSAYTGPWTLDPAGERATRGVSTWGTRIGDGIQVRASNTWGDGPWSPAAGIDKNCYIIGK